VSADHSRVVSVIFRVDEPAALNVERRPESDRGGYTHPEQIHVRAEPALIVLSIETARALVEQLTRELEKVGQS
jgi:hypothetical protein